jgi:uncharacterized protein
VTIIQDFTGLTPALFALAAAMTFGAAAIRGLTGFGMAIILVPLLGMIIKPGEAVTLAIFLQFLIGPVGIRTILADAHRPSALLIGGVAFATTPLGVWALANTSPDVARLMIALIAIGAFLLVILAKKSSTVPGRPAQVSVGMASGILTGFAAMPGPPVIPFYLRESFAPMQARASMMLVFFITATAGTLATLALQIADMTSVWLALALFIPMTFGNWLGGLAFGKLAPAVWRGAVALLLGLAAASAMWRLIS